MNLLGTGTQRSGKFSWITVGAAATVLRKSSFEVSYEGEDLDTVNFTSIGLGEGILGVEQVSFNFAGDWDASRNVFDNPPAIFPRDDLDDLRLYLNLNDNQFWQFPYARLRSATNGAEVRGKVSFGSSGLSQGPFVTPTGNV